MSDGSVLPDSSSSEDTGRSPERAAGALSSPVGERAAVSSKVMALAMAISASRAAVSGSWRIR